MIHEVLPVLRDNRPHVLVLVSRSPDFESGNGVYVIPLPNGEVP